MIMVLAMIGSGRSETFQRAVGWCETVGEFHAKSPLSLLSKERSGRATRNSALKNSV